MKNPMIEFKDFTFKYRTQTEPTLQHINLTIYEGEKVLIVGPSGSGKSTLAHCINGLVPFSYTGDVTGSLKINGKDPAGMGIFGLSKIVGTVLQDPDGQFIGLTVAEDIAFSMENDCIQQPIMKQKVMECAKLVGVDQFIEHSPQALSGGQKQRVAIAGVMTSPVNILLFDEPLANLDPATGKYAIELIDEIHNTTKATIVIIEHRLEDVLHRDVDRIVVVDDGRIVADMLPDELLSTSILKEVGIREPLYISALKYAGCEINANDKPSHVETMRLDHNRHKVHGWYQAMKRPVKELPAESILSVEKLSFSYKDQNEVLQDITFSIQKGEMISIVGKNGAGKSTLSKLICGFEVPTTGRILYQGNDMIKDSIKKRAEKIGIVMQNPNQMISKAMIFDEVALGLRARGVKEDEIRKRVEDTLKICGLYPFRNWPISALSFGQKKRVTIASILVLNPQVLILDEPTAGQDFKHYTDIMEFLEMINKEYGITIIMITHDMHLMLEYSKRAIVISDGLQIAIDSAAAILTNESIIDKASLKVTSLYELAIRCDIPDPISFIERFIDFDKEVRTQ
ncbi:MAG: transporter [Herbinix sp.]|jgi:energy-coupling factor transport system ATP-binding protein|nr:transporter [Herbinix sp.]